MQFNFSQWELLLSSQKIIFFIFCIGIDRYLSIIKTEKKKNIQIQQINRLTQLFSSLVLIMRIVMT